MGRHRNLEGVVTGVQVAPDAFGKHTAAEVDKWRKVATESNITVD